MPRERSGLPPLRSGMGAGPLIEAAGLAEVTAPQGAPRGKWDNQRGLAPIHLLLRGTDEKCPIHWHFPHFWPSILFYRRYLGISQEYCAVQASNFNSLSSSPMRTAYPGDANRAPECIGPERRCGCVQ
jgi:hypothetical protein